MMDQRQNVKRILRRVLERSRADETEACLTLSDECITRFSMNRIHQNMVEEGVSLGLRVRMEDRIGAARTTRVDDESIAQTLQRAIRMAEVAAPGRPGDAFVGQDEICRVEPTKSSQEPIDPIDVGKRVQAVCDTALGMKLQAAGNFTVSRNTMGIGTSRAGVVVDAFSSSFLNVMAINEKDGTSGWASSAASTPDDIAHEALAQEALVKATVRKVDEPCPAGEYPVVLDPYAVAEMVSLLAASGFNAWAYHNQSSVVSGRMGERVFQDTVTIRDDAYDPRGCPRSFDFDGVEKQVVPLIKDGVVSGIVYDRDTAAQFGERSTGHAQPRPALYLPGPQAENLFFEPGTASMQELVRELNRGLYVTRFQYTTVLDPSDLTINGTSRDGTFWVEDGRVQHAIPNVSFRFSIVESLRDVRRIGADAKLLKGLFGFILAPPLLLDSFTIV